MALRRNRRFGVDSDLTSLFVFALVLRLQSNLNIRRSNWHLSWAVIGFHIMSITFFLQRSGGNCSVALERIFLL